MRRGCQRAGAAAGHNRAPCPAQVRTGNVTVIAELFSVRDTVVSAPAVGDGGSSDAVYIAGEARGRRWWWGWGWEWRGRGIVGF